VTYADAVIIAPNDLLQHLVRQEGDWTSNVWKSPMGWNEVEAVSLSVTQHAKNSDIDVIL
jgi:phage-related protein